MLVFKMTAMVGLVGTDHISKTVFVSGYEIIEKKLPRSFWGAGITFFIEKISKML